MPQLVFSFLLFFSLTLQAGSDQPIRHFDFDFTQGKALGFEPVFRDLPVDIYNEYLRRQVLGLLGPIAPLPGNPGEQPEDQTHWLLNAGIFPLPDGLKGSGFLLQSNNHSDDLDMYLVRQFGPAEGLQPNGIYQVRVTVDLAGDAPHGAVGVGGEPELKIQAVLVNRFDPRHWVTDEIQHIRHPEALNSFPRAVVATNAVCDLSDGRGLAKCPMTGRIPYQLKMGQPSEVMTIQADSQGSFWVMVGSHSGFESFTGIYYTRIRLELIPANKRVLRTLKGVE